MNMKRILVAGGAGFLGANLCEFLLKRGDNVVCLDDLSTGRMANIDHLKDDSRFRFIKHDIVNALEIDGVDEIYNLACPASPPHYQKDPIKTLNICFVGTMNLLDVARKNCAKILQASTSEIYGEPLIHPQIESYRGNVNTLGPRACYDEGKRISETLCREFSSQYGVDARLVRIFNTYGPKMDPHDGRVVSNFIMQALKGDDITLYGDGSQTRSFCYVDDLIRGFTSLMDLDTFSVECPVNLGNPYEQTVAELAHRILELTKSKSNVIYMDLPIDDPTQRKPDISRANDMLGWRPLVDVDEGLSKTIDYFKRYI